MKEFWKGIGLFVGVIGLLTLAFAFAEAHGQDAPLPYSQHPTLGQTKEVLLFGVDKAPEALIFISQTGEVAAVSYESCRDSQECAALVVALIHDKRLRPINLHAVVTV